MESRRIKEAAKFTFIGQHEDLKDRNHRLYRHSRFVGLRTRRRRAMEAIQPIKAIPFKPLSVRGQESGLEPAGAAVHTSIEPSYVGPRTENLPTHALSEARVASWTVPLSEACEIDIDSTIPRTHKEISPQRQKRLTYSSGKYLDCSVSHLEVTSQNEETPRSFDALQSVPHVMQQQSFQGSSDMFDFASTDNNFMFSSSATFLEYPNTLDYSMDWLDHAEMLDPGLPHGYPDGDISPWTLDQHFDFLEYGEDEMLAFNGTSF